MKQKTLFGHPAGLFALFFTEMWERFSYYGMRALLVLYMTQHLIQQAESQDHVLGFGFLRRTLESWYGPLSHQALASQIYGLYTGFVYFTPFFGGILADQLLGKHKSVVIGGVLIAAGHFLMMSETTFLLALVFLILGNGCFKPNISTQVGGLYPPGDPRRDGAFTIFYMGINLGAFFSPLICGTLGQLYGWHYGFGAAGIGMLIGLVLYLSCQRYLIDIHTLPNIPGHITQNKLDLQAWQTIIGLIVLAMLNIVFWAVYEQQGNTLQLFAEYETDRHILGWEMPSTWFQSLNPAFIFVLSPLLSKLWRYQSNKGAELSSIAKMALGATLLGMSFLVLIYALNTEHDSQKIDFFWLLICTLIYTLGELYLSPIGLSLVSKVSPPGLVGMMMGMWFLSSFFGNYLSGYIGSYYETMPRQQFFMLLATMGIATGLAIYACKSTIKKAVGIN